MLPILNARILQGRSMGQKLLRTALISLLAAQLITGCAPQFDNAYVFPEEGLGSLADAADIERLPGFADSLCVPEGDGDIDAEGVDADAYALFSLDDGRVLSSHNIYEKEYPASVTKVLTCLIALEHGNLDDIVTVPEESDITVSGSSMAGLVPGDTLTLRELLYALMVPSGNDAAAAVACYISGSTDSFADLMNSTARRLGATHSHFVNPHGLPDEEHYTTVYDMYLIFNEAMKHDEFCTISGTPSYTCTLNTSGDPANEPREVTWESGNAFYSGKFSFADNMQIVAGKTGHTSAAGFCLALGAVGSSGRRYISIIFNSYIYENLYAGMAALNAKSGE